MEKKKDRLRKVFNLCEPDRTPVLGGWLMWPPHITALAGKTEEQYWADQMSVSIEAYRNLGCDGITEILIPKKGTSGYISYEFDTSKYKTPECVRDYILSLPDSREVEKSFDFDSVYNNYADELRKMQNLCGDMLWCPMEQQAVEPDFMMGYLNFGFDNYFSLLALYPEAALKYFKITAAKGRCLARVIARTIKEGLHPKIVFTGQDICAQDGPMCSPAMLNELYFPLVKYSFEPLLDVGARIVWHCDGDTRLILDSLIEAGVSGFQGFQDETEMTLDFALSFRAYDGKPLIIFGPISVGNILQKAPEDVTEAVKAAIKKCRGKAFLVLFISNALTKDIPIENIRAMYNADRSL